MTEEILVYGAGWCPDVRRTRALLDRLGVDHRYVDVDADPAAEREVRRLQRGKRRIRTVVLPPNGQSITPLGPTVRCTGWAVAWLSTAPCRTGHSGRT